jgi:hypothetical protein
MSGGGSEPTSSEDDKDVLLQETQRVLNEQIKIVQEQQAQATRIIRVALTVGGLLLTGISILVSSPLFPASQNTLNLADFSTESVAIGAIIGLYILLFLLITFGKIFASALIVLSPESGGVAMLRNNPLSTILRFYRRKLIPSPLSEFLALGGEKEGMTLRPGIDADEITNILADSASDDKVVERIVSYNSGCIQGNEQLIEDNRERLSEIYGIGVIAILILSVATLMGFSFAISVMLQ